MYWRLNPSPRITTVCGSISSGPINLPIRNPPKLAELVNVPLGPAYAASPLPTVPTMYTQSVIKSPCVDIPTIEQGTSVVAAGE